MLVGIETTRNSAGNANRSSLVGSAASNTWSSQQRHPSEGTLQSTLSHGRCGHDHSNASDVISLGACRGGDKKKRVLLVDSSQAKRELRAEVMRMVGMDVDCAADIAEARSWWRAGLYDLVLVSMHNGHGHRDKFCDEIRCATPPQRLAFLVGQPEYLRDSPRADQESAVQEGDEQIVGDMKVALSADHGGLSQRWGILGASRRISVVRSASLGRIQQMRSAFSATRV